MGIELFYFQRKGNEWWTDETKEAIDEKWRAYKKLVQRNVAEKIRVRRRTEYKTWNKKVKELVQENKR